ncbi:MAG: hypothetical protein C0467_12425 [Planctomycetaceae bacterium]|nr:hypothetical protein [Planctomycetaceae bacterium]
MASALGWGSSVLEVLLHGKIIDTVPLASNKPNPAKGITTSRLRTRWSASDECETEQIATIFTKYGNEAVLLKYKALVRNICA